MRLFIAINFDKLQKDKLITAQDVLKDAVGGKGRFVKEDNLHITLVFLGEVEASRLQVIKDAMDKVTLPPLILHSNRLATFSSRKGQTIYIGIEEDKMLLSLHAQLIANLIDKGCRLEQRIYKPHITIARDVNIEKEQLALINILQFEFKVESIDLMHSQSIGRRQIYNCLYKRSL